MPRRLETVHKTVRFTQDQIDFINAQGSGTFTDNLFGLLGELMTGETERVRALKRYDESIAMHKARLERMLRYSYDYARYLNSLSHSLELASGLEELLQEDGKPPKAPSPGDFL